LQQLVVHWRNSSRFLMELWETFVHAQLVARVCVTELSWDSLLVWRISSLLDPNLHKLHINKGSSVAPVPSGGLLSHLVPCICQDSPAAHNFCAVFTRTLYLLDFWYFLFHNTPFPWFSLDKVMSRRLGWIHKETGRAVLSWLRYCAPR